MRTTFTTRLHNLRFDSFA